MLKKVKEEKPVNAQASPSKQPICQKCKKLGHTMGEHHDDYRLSFTPATSQPKKKSGGHKRKIIKKRARPNSTMMLYKSSRSQNKILMMNPQGMPHTLQKQAGLCSHPIKTYPLQNVLCMLNALGRRRNWMMIMHVDRHYVPWCMTLIMMMTIMATSTSNFTLIQSLSVMLAHKYHKQTVKNPSAHSIKTSMVYGS